MLGRNSCVAQNGALIMAIQSGDIDTCFFMCKESTSTMQAGEGDTTLVLALDLPDRLDIVDMPRNAENVVQGSAQ